MNIPPLDEMLTLIQHMEKTELKKNLFKFAKESNEIEGITKHQSHVNACARIESLLDFTEISIESVCNFNTAGALRSKPGMNVRVGRHRPISGGNRVSLELKALIREINSCSDPYKTHVKFEKLHPFTDGNGRTGRAIWAWQMVNQKGSDLALGFLHIWYYQSLN